MDRVVITGTGVICPIGLNIEEFWQSLSSGRSGVGRITRFDASTFPVKVAAEVRDFDPSRYIDQKTIARSPRSVHLAIPATEEAVNQAGLRMSEEDPERVGIVCANMIDYQYIGQNWERLKNLGPKRVDPLMFSKAGPSTVSMQIGMLLGAKGPNATINTLCASGAEAIAVAGDYIRLGYADVMLAVASDASLSELGLAAISILGALTREADPEKASRPFDLNRSGFVYGEGCGVVLLESLKHACSRGVPVLAELIGAWRNYDAYDATAPNPDSQASVIRLALRSAAVAPQEIDYINAHGTSTKLNDASETKAVKMAFGNAACAIPISSFKSMFGHPLTAAGVIETVGMILAMENSLIPPTIHYETPDPECDLDYVPNVPRPKKLGICLKNSFGLGGQNCCLVLKRYCG